MSEARPIVLRAHTEPAKHGKKSASKPGGAASTAQKLAEPKWPEYVLVFDCETTTDERQSLTFAGYRYCKLRANSVYECIREGFVFADDLPEANPEAMDILRRYCDTNRANTRAGFPNELELLSRADFVERVFWHAIDAGAAVVGFNLPFDLSRLAVDCRKARRRNDGWSLILSQDKDPETGLLRHNPLRSRIVVTPKDAKAAFIRLAGTGIRSKKTGKRIKPYRAGRFLDLRTLGWALRNKSYSLESACQDFKVEGKIDHTPTGRISIEEVRYCRQDVRATVALLNAMRIEFDRHPVDLHPERAFSPASIAKEYLAKMGIIPPSQKFNLPPWLEGVAMQAYYGGRAECRIRHTEVPIVLTDFMSEYPTVNVLMGLWQMLTADHLGIEECAEEIEGLLKNVTLEKTFDQNFWKTLTFFALVRPSATVVPVRLDYNGKTSNIGVNPLTSGDPIWYAGPDLVAAVLQSGQVPEIVRAVRIVPEGKQSGLRPVALRGMIEVDPATGDFFKCLIEARARTKSDQTSDSLERELLAYFLKILANAGSYGLFVEVNPERVGGRESVRMFSGEISFETTSLVLEPPGKWYCPVFGALITAAGRLLLTLLECSVRNLGGSYLFCDTDSMAIVASQSGGLFPCDGGPHLLPDGRAAVKVLTWEEARGIVAKFERLNPYSRDAVHGSILKIEDVNYRDGNTEQLFGWAIAAKRYALYTHTSSGDIEIRKASGHGLGFLYHPRTKNDPAGDVPPWVLEGWEWILREDQDIPQKEPRWFKHPAMMRIAITTPEVLKSLQAHQVDLPYRDGAKPFNFVLMPIIDETDGYPAGVDANKFTLIAPFTSDVARWYRMRYLNIHDGNWYSLAPADRKRRPYEAGAKTRGDYVRQYRWHPESKNLAPDGGRCNGRTRGLLRRTPVIAAWPPNFIGKETDRRWEQGEDISIMESEVTKYRPNETARLVSDPALQKQLLKHSIRTVAKQAGISETTVKAARRGGPLRKSTVEKLWAALSELLE
jgi:hypothetical protein